MKPAQWLITKIFIGLTLVGALIALLQVWNIISISHTTLWRLLVTYGILSGLLFLFLLMTIIRTENPRNADGDKLIS